MTNEHDQTGAQHLARLIEEDGPVTIATLMEVALADPGHGYYRARPGIGADGDFITAPEISQLFGEMVGVFVLQAWLDLGAPQPWQLVELGPGRGTLMADVLRVLNIRPQALQSAQIHLIETSEPLRRTQEAGLAAFGKTPRWHAGFGEIEAAPCVAIANEFFDALPIRQFLRLNGTWCERRVALAETSDGATPAFRFIAVPTLFDVESEVPAARDAADGAIVELSQAARAIAAEIGARFARNPGRALFIDYGYAGERHGDTLQAIRAHKPANVLEDIAHADLTAHVDFAALVRAAALEGAVCRGPITQRDFLSAMGIAERHAQLSARANEAQREALNRGLERLTAPRQMGDLFRVLAISSPHLPAPPAFEAVP